MYYKVFVQESAEIVTASARYDFPNGREDAQIFRWLSREDLAKEEFTFPVDRVVVERLLFSLI
ncbi:MAG TPA: hypothetical protein ENJ82_09400 [Bacteroidetes bacterium]|nr:hypothetical protein [Bacteroidota bacterium]